MDPRAAPEAIEFRDEHADQAQPASSEGTRGGGTPPYLISRVITRGGVPRGDGTGEEGVWRQVWARERVEPLRFAELPRLAPLRGATAGRRLDRPPPSCVRPRSASSRRGALARRQPRCLAGLRPSPPLTRSDRPVAWPAHARPRSPGLPEAQGRLWTGAAGRPGRLA